MQDFLLYHLRKVENNFASKSSYIYLTILTVVFFCSIILFCSHLLNILKFQNFTDFHIFFQAAEKAQNNHPIYDVDEMYNRPFVQYKYPPIAAHILKFFVPFGVKNVALVWFFLNVAFYVGSLIIWIKIAKIPFFSSKTLLLASMLFSSLPPITSLSGTQQDCFMLLLLFVCCWGIFKNKPVFSGGSIAVLTMIKVFPIVLLFPFVQSKRLRPLKTFFAIFCLLLFLSVMLAGLEEHKIFLFEVLPAHDASTAYVENQSLFGFLARFYADGSTMNDGRPTDLPGVLLITRVIGFCMLIITLYISRNSAIEIGVASVLVWLLITLPVSWIHYETLLFFPAALFLHLQLRNLIHDTLGWFLFAVAWACIAFGDHTLVLEAPVLLQSYKFYGVLILWVAYVRAMWKLRLINSFLPQ
jgi:Glycosyltransferase family 87